MRGFWIVLFLFLPTVLFAQSRDSVFSGYEEYSAFVDEKIMGRDFVPLIQFLGGRDEYTSQQLDSLNEQFLSFFSLDFENRTIFLEEDLGGDIKREARAYWTGEAYVYFYAVFHVRGQELVVLNFYVNTSLATIMSKI